MSELNDVNGYNYFCQNRQCKAFPCHTGIPIEEYNCKFCYCPLFYLGEKCGGNYTVIDTDFGKFKDCSTCTVIHTKDGRNFIINQVRNLGKEMGQL